jgi:maltoporin
MIRKSHYHDYRPQGMGVLLPLLGLLFALPIVPAAEAQPAPATDTEATRQELRELKRDYEQRLQDLEARLRKLESEATNHPPPPSGTNAAVRARQFADQEFRGDTESRELTQLAAAQPWRERMEQVLQNYLDIFGYFRAGYGRDDEGGPQVAFQAPGALAKYRLGNEAENYGELGFAKNFYVPGLFSLEAKERPDGTPTGPVARVQTRISIYNPYQNLLSPGDTQFGLPEAWAAIGNVMASQPSMKVWAGSRFYRRHDIYINDFYFYNLSGSGGGVEDVDTPIGRMAFAWIGGTGSSGFSDLPAPDANNQAGFSKSNWDLRLYDVALPLGKGEFGVTFANAQSGRDAAGNSEPGSQGAALTVLFTRQKFIAPDGVNKFSLQFGTGPAKTFTSGFETFTQTNGVFIRPDPQNSWRFRATEHFVVDVNDQFSISPALVCQITDYTSQGGMVYWTSAGVRPIWHFNSCVSLAFEGGVDWVKDNDAGTSDYLTKISLAPQVSLGGRFMSRPVVRAFVTYAHWGNEFVGQVGGPDYAGRNDGLTYGMQMEAWW